MAIRFADDYSMCLLGMCEGNPYEKLKMIVNWWINNKLKAGEPTILTLGQSLTNTPLLEIYSKTIELKADVQYVWNSLMNLLMKQ